MLHAGPTSKIRYGAVARVGISTLPTVIFTEVVNVQSMVRNAAIGEGRNS